MSEQMSNLLLVGEVQKRPILYNFYLPGYSKKHESEKAWVEVSNIVKLTAAECKERWRNIRAVFVRHMKALHGGSCTKYKKAYYLTDAMQFTVPYIKVLGKASETSPQIPLNGEEILAEKNAEDDEYDPLGETSLPSPSSQPPSKHDDVNEEFIEYVDRTKANSVKSIQMVTEPREEALKMFLLSMLPDLMQMNDQELRQFKRKTLDVVDDILSGKSTHFKF